MTFQKLSSNKRLDYNMNMISLFYTFERAIYLHMPIQHQDFLLVINTTNLGIFRGLSVLSVVTSFSVVSVAYQHIPPMMILQEMLEALNDHYKRRIGTIFVLGVSWFVNRAYDMVRYMNITCIIYICHGSSQVSYAMSEVTKKKINFLSSDPKEIFDKFSLYMDTNNIPGIFCY